MFCLHSLVRYEEEKGEGLEREKVRNRLHNCLQKAYIRMAFNSLWFVAHRERKGGLCRILSQGILLPLNTQIMFVLLSRTKWMITDVLAVFFFHFSLIAITDKEKNKLYTLVTDEASERDIEAFHE